MTNENDRDGDGSGDDVESSLTNDFYTGRVHPTGSSCAVFSLGKSGQHAGWGYSCNMFTKYDIYGDVALTQVGDVHISWRGFGYFVLMPKKSGVKYCE